MTRRAGGQLGLFGNPVPASTGAVVPLVESNDVDLMHTVAANAIRCGYLLVGAGERVYAADSDHHDEVVRVPRYEDDSVHQLLRRRWLSRGGPRHVTCGAVSFTGTAVLVPKETRSRVARWQHLHRPPSWPSASPDGPTVTTPGRVVRLDDHRHHRSTR